jgi:type VI secretion system VgrG family protein
MNTDLSTQDLRKLAAGMQNKRLLRLTFPRGDAPYEILLANRLEGEEYLSRDFRFVVEILSDNAKLDPNDFVDKQISVQLLRDDGSFRYFNGYIFSFRLAKTDGGIAFYEAEMGPWLRYLTLRKNNRLFLDQAIQGQTAAIFSDYGALAVWDWKVREKDPVMPMACQFDEHDHNYVHRRWEHRGLCYWFEHTQKEHKLIVSDPKRNEPVIDGPGPEIPFQDQAGSKEADGIKSWSLIHQSTSTHVAESRTDFKHFTLNARSGGFVDSRTDAWKDSGKRKLELYRYAGSFGHQNTEDGQKLTDVQVEAIEAIARQWEATGNNRYVMPGRWFQLTDHFGYPIGRDKYDDEYLITYAHHVATNNYLQGVNAPATYSNRFRCVHLRTPWRPARGYNSVDTRILAPQTAMVVGPERESLYTDEYGRVLVQFHWDREGKYTTWVRVSTGWAGGNQGMTALPRIGSEVIVMWLDGNPDHPIITGRLHGRDNMSAWRLPHQRALTGIRSRELIGDQGNQDGGRSNHLVFDDTANAIQTQLRSDHAASQLSLGSITRIEDWQGRQEARGEGFELRTDAVGAIRSGKGMLVSTEVRRQGTSHISDVSEPASRLMSAQALQNELGKLAQLHQAQDSGADQTRVAEALKSQSDGIRGSRGGGASFPELNEPHLVIAGAAGLEMTTPATAHVAAAEHVAITSGASVSVATGKSLFASVMDKLSVFVQNAGMKLFAAKGKVEIQAQSDNVELTAQKTVKVVSTTERIEVTAKQEILLTSGGAYIRIKDGNIEIHAPGKIDIKGSTHSLSGPASTDVVMPHLPQGEASPTDLEFRLVDPYGRPSPGVEYKTTLSDGSVKHGVLDADGYAKISDVPPGTSAKVQYLADKNPPKSEVGIKSDSDWSQFQSIKVTAKPLADAGNTNDPDLSATV